MKRAGWALIVVFGLCAGQAMAAPNRVGNGDDGGDLEKGTPVTSGILIETRNEAVALLRKLNVSGIEGLGGLMPEVETAPLVLVGKNVVVDQTSATPEQIEKSKEEARSIGATTEGDRPVFARTFPEAHAATRFFPSALLLERKQLVALHVHEALHRALPKEIREDEKAVSRVTLAISSEGATFDRVNEAMAQVRVAAAAKPSIMASAPYLVSPSMAAAQMAGAAQEESSVRAKLGLNVDGPLVKRPSTFEYSYRSFVNVDEAKSNAPVSSIHSIKSFLYPFGGRADALGIGIEATYIKLPEQSYLGPLGISARLKLATWRDFDVDAFGAFHLYTIAADEFKGSPLARDTFTGGFSIRRETSRFRFENQIYMTAGSQSKQSLGNIEYTHSYGSTMAARVGAAAKVPLAGEYNLDFGGNGEVLLANPYTVQGGNFSYSSDRIRVVSVGPEVAIENGEVRFAINGRYVIDSTNKVSLDQLGDLIGQGVGQGSVGGSLSWKF